MENHRLSERFSSEQVHQRVRELAAEIRTDYEGEKPIVVGILKGAFVFLADLVRYLDLPVEVDFIRLASYGTTTQSSGTIEIKKDVELPLEGRHVLVVEDIVDSGITIAWLRDHLLTKNPKSVKICAFIDKRERREKEVVLDYVGFEVPAGFLVGYGLDYAEQYRQLPGIYEVQFV